ncbi:hypothetical protein QAD02_006522 [Eretmocerus hayati]|uniref:Uncharacterized protein n=1 Tax=Eretmocerus hayati TaxID=131215 RepID=A0ACC2N5F4_9HYME|nr:hypothetical protein QAD02_006522 [Eretmocerus hayati]
MGYFHRALILCAVIYLVDICTLSSGFEDGYYDLEFYVKGNPVTILDKKLGPNGTVLFGYCERNSKFWNFWRGVSTSSLECDIVLHNLPLNEKEPPKKKCPIELKGEDIRDLSLEHIGIDRAIIQYYETKSENNYFKLALIDMDTCHTIWYENLDVEYLGHLITSEDGFDIVTSDSNACDYHKLCLISFNKKGERIRNPIGFPIKVRTGYQVDTLLTNEGLEYFVASSRNSETFELSHVDSLGIKTSVRTAYSIPEHNISTSNSHGRFGFCSTINSSSFQCMQFNSDDRIIINQTISLSSKSDVFKVHNAPNNSLIIFFTECTEGPKERECQDLYAIKIYESGEENMEVVRRVVSSDYIHSSTEHADSSSEPSTNASKSTERSQPSKDSDEPTTDGPESSKAPVDPSFEVNSSSSKPEYSSTEAVDKAITSISTSTEKFNNDVEDADTTTQQVNASTENNVSSVKPTDAFSENVDQSSNEIVEDEVKPLSFATESVSPSIGSISSSSSDPADDTADTIDASTYIPNLPINNVNPPRDFVFPTNELNTLEEGPVLSGEPRDLSARQLNQPIAGVESTEGSLQSSTEHIQSSNGLAHTSTESVDLPTEQVNVPMGEVLPAIELVHASVDQTATSLEPIASSTEHVEQSSEGVQPSVNSVEVTPELVEPTKIIANSSTYRVDSIVTPTAPSTEPIERKSDQSAQFSTLPTDSVNKHVEPARETVVNPIDNINSSVKPTISTTERFEHSSERVHKSTLPTEPVADIDPVQHIADDSTDHNVSSVEPIASSTEHVDHSSENAHAPSLPTDPIAKLFEPVKEINHASIDHVESLIDPVELIDQIVDSLTEDLNPPNKYVNPSIENVEPAVEHVNPIILLGRPLIELAEHTVIKLGYPVIKPVESDSEPDNQSIRSNEFDLHTTLPSKQSPALVYPPLVRESDVIPSRIRQHFYRSPKLPSRRHRRPRYHRTVQSPRQFRGALGLRSGFIY